MLIIKGDTVLDVSAKAYEVIYKDHGYTEQTDIEPETEEPKVTAKKQGKPKAGDE